MNVKMMGRFIAQIIAIEAAFMIPALAISLGYGEAPAAKAFAISSASTYPFVSSMISAK